MTKAAKAERDQAITQLKDWIKPGDTVYTILDSVSRSGMSRQIRVVVPTIDRHDDEHKPATMDFLHPNYSVAKAIGARQAKSGAIVMGGAGMDMGFALVYELSQTLYGSGYACLGKGLCPSNYHVNHRDHIHCEGFEDRRCYAPSVWGRWKVAEDWPRRIIEVDGHQIDAGYLACLSGSGEDGKPYEICPTCQGVGSLPNPEGPERFDLVHTDGYAVRHKWL
jgi:hypothetical protein